MKLFLNISNSVPGQKLEKLSYRNDKGLLIILQSRVINLFTYSKVTAVINYNLL